MLAEFIVLNRAAIIAGVRARLSARTLPTATFAELNNGVPVFLDQLGDALRIARSTDVIDHAQIVASAARHGADLFKMGLTIGQVVHDYGDVCQTVTEVAIERHAAISGQEFQVLNLCLDDAIAGAVTQYADEHERALVSRGTESLGSLAHELRNLLTTAMLTFGSIRAGRVTAAGSTGMVHERSLLGLRNLIDRTLADVRLDAGMGNSERITVADLVEELEIGARLHADSRGLSFTANTVDRALMIDGDRHTVAAAVSNLLQNAFKFTRKGSAVSLTTRSENQRVLFEVEDECGGLPPGKAEELFEPYMQKGSDRSGLGLGLAICLKSARANGGSIQVRNLPGKGCVFCLDLPRASPPPLKLVESVTTDGGELPTTVLGDTSPPGHTRASAS